VQRSDDGCDVKKLRVLTMACARQLWICWRWFIWDLRRL